MKKVLLLLLVWVTMTFMVHAQIPIFTEGFESGAIPAGWTIIDADGDGSNWANSSSNSDITAHTGSFCAWSASYYSGALTPDNWLVTPAISVTGETTTLTFWEGPYSSSYAAEHYGVYVSTTSASDTSAFTMLMEETNSASTWTMKTVDLSAYEGETIYIAFRHFNCTNEYYFLIDDITVTTSSTDPMMVVNPTSHNFYSVLLGQSSIATFNVAGYNLTDNISLSVTGPYELSADTLTWSSTLSLPAEGGNFFVRFTPTSTETETATIALSCGSTTASIALTGAGLDCSNIVLPFIESFESPTLPPDCWTVRYGSSNPVNTISYSSVASLGQQSVKFATASYSADLNQYLITPELPADEAKMLTFDYRMYGYFNQTFKVGYSTTTNEVSAFTWFLPLNVSNQYWETYTNLNIPADAKYIAIDFYSDYSFWAGAELYVDNFRVNLAPTCVYPSNLFVNHITGHTAEVHWTPAQQAEGTETYYVEYKAEGTTDWLSANTTASSIVLTDLVPETEYDVRVFMECSEGTSDTVQTDFETVSACMIPVDLTVSSVTGTSALVSWTPDASVAGTETYHIIYAPQGTENWQTVTTANSQYMISGLEQHTTYNVMLYMDCDEEGTSDTLTGSFETRCLIGGTIPVGNGSETTGNFPISTCYNYSISQQLYTSAEIGGGSFAINGIRLNVQAGVTSVRDVTIYMGNTTVSGLNSESDYISTTNQTQVYSGNLSVSNAGWLDIPFATPFNYTGANIVLTVHDHTGSYQCTAYFYAHTGNSLYYSTDSSNPDPTAPSSLYTNTYRNNIVFLADCDSTATCIAPNAYVAGVGSDEVTVAWVAGTSETSWTLEYKAENDIAWTSEGTVTASPYTISELQPNTNYVVRIGTDCGENTLWRTLTARTICVATSVPFAENFDLYSTNALPDCWVGYTNNSYTDYPYISDYYAHSGDKSLQMYGSGNEYSYAVLPELDEDVELDTLQVSFYMYKSYSSYTGMVELGFMTDPTDIATFTSVSTYSLDPAEVWTKVEFNTRGYAGQARYLAIRAMQVNSNTFYIDDLTVDYIPACTHVSNVVANNVTATTASISWTPGGEEAQWDVVYGLVGQVDPEDAITVYEDSLALEDLQANTEYQVMVRSNCGSDLSEWETINFRTSCSDLTSLPYIDDFDSYVVSGYNMPPCWSRVEYLTYGSTYPYLNNYSYDAHSGSNMLVIYTDETQDVMAMMPTLSETISMNTLQLSFWARTYDSDPIIVGVMSDEDASTFVVVDTVGNITNSYAEYTVRFNNYVGTGNRIAFKYSSTEQWGGTLYIDDITLETITGCDAPASMAVSNVTATTADLSWTVDTASTITAWQIVLAEGSETPDFSNPVNVSTNPYTLTDLESNTLYTAYLRNVCPDGTTYSSWIHTSFATISASPATLPYFNNFENAEENAEWVFANGNINKWYIGAPTQYSDSVLFISQNGTTATYNSNSSCVVWAYRDIVFPAAAEYNLSFKWRCNGESSYDYFKVYVGAPVMVQASTNYTIDDPTGATVLPNTDGRLWFNGKTAWQNYSIALDSSFVGTQRLYFAWKNDGSGGSSPAAVIDSICIVASNCARPADLTADEVRSTSVDLTFTPGLASDQNWEYVYGTGAFDPNTATPTPIQDDEFTITGLNPETSYTVYVRTDCGDEYSAWSNALTFTTLVSCPAVDNVAASNITTTSADITWDEMGEATAWNLEYGPAGFTQGQGTLVTPTTTTYSLTGLSMATSYDVYVQANCGVDDQSIWSQVLQFATECETYTTFPYTEGFENAGNMPNCWSQEYVSGTINWTFTNGSTSGVTSAHTGSYNALLKGTSRGSVTRLISPIFDLTGLNNPYLSYWYAQIPWTPDQDTLAVYYRTSSSSEWVYLTSYTSSITEWTFDSLALPNPSATYQLAFQGGVEWGYGVLLDDITIDGAGGPTPPTPGDTCLTPTAVAASNVTYNSASINWTAGGDETAWNLQYKKATDAAWSNSIAVTARPYTLSALDAETAYQVRVQADCGEGETSDWSTVANFTTAATPVDPCDDPTGLTVGNITAHTAVATWTAGGDETAWNIQYKLSSASEWNSATSSTPSYSLEGLTPQSEYTVQVQANCGEGNVSNWVSTTFTTLVDGISSVELANSISIMPNPAESYIELTVSSNVNVKEAAIYNAFGQMIQKVTLTDNHARIDVSGMAAGMYFVRIANDNSMATKKFIKK